MNTTTRVRWIWLVGLLAGLLGLVACTDSNQAPGDGDSDAELEVESDATACTPGTKVCQGSQMIFRCSADGEWEQYGFCTGLQTCQGGLCIGTADGDAPDGDRKADGPTDGDGDADYLCTPASFRCREDVLEHCNPIGDWEFYRDCRSAGKRCDGGECVASGDGDGDPDGDAMTCTPGERRCADDGSVERCSVYGNAWNLWQTCSDLQTCTDGECVVPPGEVCTLAAGCEDDNEYCLADEIGSENGHCMPFCDRTGINCRHGYECKHGLCVPIEGYCQSDVECDMDEFCDKLPMMTDGRCKRYCDLPGENCPDLYICDSDVRSPNYGRCVLQNPDCEPCSYDLECGDDMICFVSSGHTMGCCAPACSEENECPGQLVCLPDGRCGVEEPGDCGGDCPPGTICDPLYDQCIIDCPACGPNECCDLASAPTCYTCQCVNPPVCGVLLEPCCYGYNCSAIVYGVVGYCI